MSGVMLKAVREAAPVTLIFCVAFMLIELLMTYIMPQLDTDLLGEFWLRMPFVRRLISAMLGADVGTELTPRLLVAFFWAHPVVLATVWGHAVIHLSRLPAGEIDRGTIDVLLAHPVSRRGIYVAETIVWLAAGAVLLAVGLGGYLLGAGRMEADARPETAQVLIVFSNLLALYVAVGGMTLLCSALSDRRGRVIGVVFAILVASLLLNFLATFLPWARRLAFLGVLDHYRPFEVLRTGQAPLGDIGVLLAFAVVTWTAGCEVFARRSICTT